MRVLFLAVLLSASGALADDDDDRSEGPGLGDAVDVVQEVAEHHKKAPHREAPRPSLLRSSERQLVVEGGMSWEELAAINDAAAKAGVRPVYAAPKGVPLKALPGSFARGGAAATGELGSEAALAGHLGNWGDDAARVGGAAEFRAGAAMEGAALGGRGAVFAERAAVGTGAAVGLADDAVRWGARAVGGGAAAAGLGAAALGSRRRRH